VQRADESQTSLAGPSQLDRYEVLSTIGRGGFGAVFLARHRMTGREVALKVSDPGGDPELLARALNEARATASLRHPSLVEVFDCGPLPDGRIFVAMERVDGLSLDALLEREGARIAPERAVAIALQVLSALSLVHGVGVVHRDIKPANILVRRDESQLERAFLIDFGASKVSSSDPSMALAGTMAGAILGTPGYMAPEQMDARTVDARADVYGVGATLYRAISGRKPYATRTLEEWVRAVAEGPVPPLATVAPWVSSALASVIDRALARDRDARFATAAALSDALRRALAGDALTESASTVATAAQAAGVNASRALGTADTVYATSASVTTPTSASGQGTLSAVTTATPEVARRARWWIAGGAIVTVAVASVMHQAAATSQSANAEEDDRVVLQIVPASREDEPERASREDDEPSTADIVRAALAPALARSAPAPTPTPTAAPSPTPTPTPTPTPSAPVTAAGGALDASSIAPPALPAMAVSPSGRLRLVSMRPVGAIAMDEMLPRMTRALAAIEPCHTGAGPARTRISVIVRLFGGPMASSDGDAGPLARCAESALIGALGTERLRSNGILTAIVLEWR
jgi:serine/threonine-protein kinase